jgi:hypothetical protein
MTESSETTVQKNSLRGHNRQAVCVSQLLRGTSGVQPLQKNCTQQGTSPDLYKVNYARPVKVTKAERFLKRGQRGSYTRALIFKPSRCLAKGKFVSLVKTFCLSKSDVAVSTNSRSVLLTVLSCWYALLYSTFSGTLLLLRATVSLLSVQNRLLLMFTL